METPREAFIPIPKQPLPATVQVIPAPLESGDSPKSTKPEAFAKTFHAVPAEGMAISADILEAGKAAQAARLQTSAALKAFIADNIKVGKDSSGNERVNSSAKDELNFFQQLRLREGISHNEMQAAIDREHTTPLLVRKHLKARFHELAFGTAQPAPVERQGSAPMATEMEKKINTSSYQNQAANYESPWEAWAKPAYREMAQRQQISSQSSRISFPGEPQKQPSLWRKLWSAVKLWSTVKFWQD